MDTAHGAAPGPAPAPYPTPLHRAACFGLPPPPTLHPRLLLQVALFCIALLDAARNVWGSAGPAGTLLANAPSPVTIGAPDKASVVGQMTEVLNKEFISSTLARLGQPEVKAVAP